MVRLRVLFSGGWILTSALMLGCGAEESTTPTNDNPPIYFTTGGQSVYLKPLTPKYIAFDRSKTDPNLLVVSNRRILLNEFEVISEPELNHDKTRANTLITGIGLEAVDNSKRPLQITLGVVGREFDTKTGKFKGSTRLFSAQGDILDNAQEFKISGSNEMFMTGMGFLMKEGRLTRLQLQRKSLSGLFEDGEELDTRAHVTLPGGWAVVGILVRFKKNDATSLQPFIQDSIFYTADTEVR